MYTTWKQTNPATCVSSVNSWLVQRANISCKDKKMTQDNFPKLNSSEVLLWDPIQLAFNSRTNTPV